MRQSLTDIESFSGLSQSEIQPLLKQFGRNIFKSEKRGGFLRSVWDISKEPMFLMLITACLLYFILGELNEGLLMLAAMIFVVAISIYQESRSSSALAVLKQYAEPRIVVIRDKKEQTILSENLLPGDVIILEEGNRIPADAIVIRSNDLTVDESIITGESIPVEKNSGASFNQLSHGTTINSGMCYAKVTRIGSGTTLGKLGKSISDIDSTRTLLQEQIGRFVKIMAIFGVTAFALIWLLNYINSKDAIQSLLLGLTIAMSAVPEEIPVAFSSFMALGASNMAKLGIITRQPQTIENLGAVSVICLDKTGTITENKMQVKTIYDYQINYLEEIDDKKELKNLNVLLYARLASEMDPFDAMEKAIIDVYNKSSLKSREPNWPMIHEYPLSGQPPMMTHVYLSKNIQVVAGKGAPERILRICKLADLDKKNIQERIQQMASSGYRVLGICSVANHIGSFPEEQDDFNWKFEGLLALYDPPKKNLDQVFNKWYDAGINIKLVTGDYAETAINIAGQVGIKEHEKYMNGEEFMQLSSEELKAKITGINIYARMFPDAKLKLMEVLKTNGEVVAMTGDGVNDGPALKSAHIGIAMGNKGTELAKEAADLIITDDNLDKITDAILQGRKIYSNLKKAVRYIISIHIPIIFTASMPLLLGWKFPNIFTPIHIIFLELIMGPTCSIFFEREPVERNIMTRKPRPHKQNIFSGKELLLSTSQGVVIASGLLSLYYYFMHANYSIEYTRTIVFTTLVLSNVFLTFINRSFHETLNKTIRYKNSLAPYVLFISIIFLSSINFIKPLQVLFKLTTIIPLHYLICIIVSVTCTLWIEFYKNFLQYKNVSTGNTKNGAQQVHQKVLT